MARPWQPRHDDPMSISVLIVDDSALIRASLRSLLGSVVSVASVREAATLSEAIDSIERNPPRLVILDLRLPDGWGMDIIQQIKQMAPTLKVAMLTIYSDPMYRQRCLASGADWFFDKACETDALLDMVRQFDAQNPIINLNQGIACEPTCQ